MTFAGGSQLNDGCKGQRIACNNYSFRQHRYRSNMTTEGGKDQWAK